MERLMNRREWLMAAGAAAGLVVLPPTIVSAQQAAAASVASAAGRKRVLRLAHLTDVHVQPELGAERGMIAALHHAQSLADPPGLILFGGDCIMDSFGAVADRTELQWSMWQRVLRNECSLPIESCIGNHDIWGWDRQESATRGDEARWGKIRAMEGLQLTARYRAFDRLGWRFIVLDSTHTDGGNGYIAKLDDEQFEWLGATLAATPPNMPVLVLSHIPILSAAAYFDGDNEQTGNWVVPGSWVHIDARRIKDLFARHDNVRLALSGHLHLIDRVLYNRTTYICDGAVCGGWWKGDNQECDEGYGVVDLYADGSFEHQYVSFGWQVVEEG
jgi:3',5'-cyclic AMP phosphodiesterase CpdA